MVPAHLNQSGYVSCIKIAGQSILPPLVTEERKKELNEDKAKAVEIEKKLKRKRSSIDSGVMTGSYIDSFKNCEFQQSEIVLNDRLTISDLVASDKCSYLESDNVSSDNFLRLALEDKEFKEFFYTTAEKIFKDNNIVNVTKHIPLPHDNTFLFDNKNVNSSLCNKNNETESSEMLTDLSNILKSKDVLDVSVCNHLPAVPSAVGSVVIRTWPETVTREDLPSIHIEEPVSPPQRLVRRNSYVLESPSPVLLEHLAKEKANNSEEHKNWKSLTDKKEKYKDLGFKTFLSCRKPRKTWNRKVAERSSVFKVDNSPVSKIPCFPLKRNKTYVKKSGQTNYSLPCSKRSSPIQFSTLARSADCIKSMMENPPHLIESSTSKIHFNPEPIKEIRTPTQTNSGTVICDSENKHKGIELDSSLPNISNTSLLNNTSGSLHSDCGSDILFHFQSEPSDSESRISTIKRSSFCQHILPYSNTVASKNIQNQRDRSGEIDDSVSVCSSLSLSKFMQSDDSISRPSTNEDFSVLFSDLQLRHEHQITELLKKQHEEKVMFSKLHSNNGTLSSRSTTNLSFGDLPSENNFLQTSCSEDKKTLCSRELFPIQILHPSRNECPETREYNSGKEKDAALKLTACVRGYLTRRLFKTEKVQQLIYVIKESLTCAFSLQSEAQLKRNDLELHKRLANQLDAAFYELHAIISAPAAKRMAVIAADREKLRKPLSRPSSAISSATRKKILRRQLSLNGTETKAQESSVQVPSLCLNKNSGLRRSESFVKSDSLSVTSTNSNRKPWK